MKKIYNFYRKMLPLGAAILLFCTSLNAQEHKHFYSNFNILTVEPPCEAETFPIVDNKYVEITVKGILNANQIFVGAGSATPTHEKTFRFFTYNLGANPNMTPKEQMAYFPVLSTDMTVYGGLYQWGRSAVSHTFRCDPTPSNSSSHFTTTLIHRDTLARDHGKFIIGSNNWVTPTTNTLWGNGSGVSNQTPVSGSNNPCPAGWRVPTEHEWALLANEGGSSSSDIDDLFPPITSATLVPSGLYWVKVLNGCATPTFYFSHDGETVSRCDMCGYALYTQNEWETAVASNPGYQDGSLSLTTQNAPKPLMFLPAAGFRIFGERRSLEFSTGQYGTYWTSTIRYSNEVFNFTLNTMVVAAASPNYHAFGFSIRCVQEVNE